MLILETVETVGEFLCDYYITTNAYSGLIHNDTIN